MIQGNRYATRVMNHFSRQMPALTWQKKGPYNPGSILIPTDMDFSVLRLSKLITFVFRNKTRFTIFAPFPGQPHRHHSLTIPN